MALDRIVLDPAAVADTIGVLLKYQDDVGALSMDVITRIVDDVAAQSARA